MKPPSVLRSSEHNSNSISEIRTMRDLFQHRYYRLNKMLLKWLGLWPYQSARTRSALLAVVFCITVTQMVPQLIAMVKGRDDWEFLVECTVTFIFDAFCLTKLLTSVFNSQKMLRLLNRTRTAWHVQARDHDANIIHDYAENGRKMTIAYAVIGYVTWVLFLTQPIVPKLIDTVLRNGTEPGEFGVPVDYVVIDMQKYYFCIVLHTAVSGFMAFTISVACDSMFVVYVQHACGLYAALGRNLEQIRNRKTTRAVDSPTMNYEHLAMCVDRHNEAIKYCELIEASYTWCFFFIVGFNVFMIALTGLAIIMRTTNPQQTVKFMVGNIVSMIHLFVENYMAQLLMDHSINIRSYILNGEWYELPLKSQKVLLFMIMRCSVPSQLTAGKICVMSVQSFGMLLKTSLSYFTLLHSV